VRGDLEPARTVAAPAPLIQLVAEDRSAGGVCGRARSVLFLKGHGQPTVNLAGFVEDAIRERLERDRAELNQGEDFPPVTDHLRPGRRIGG
jgi:hypothetical protein